MGDYFLDAIKAYLKTTGGFTINNESMDITEEVNSGMLCFRVEFYENDKPDALCVRIFSLQDLLGFMWMTQQQSTLYGR